MFLYSNACIATAWFRLSQSIFLHFIAFFILKFNCFVCRSVFIHICASECLFPFVVDYVPLLHCSLYLWFRRFYISLHDCASLQACCTCGSDWQTVLLYLTRCWLYPQFRLWQTVFLYFTIGLLYPWFRLWQTVFYTSLEACCIRGSDCFYTSLQACCIHGSDCDRLYIMFLYFTIGVLYPWFSLWQTVFQDFTEGQLPTISLRLWQTVSILHAPVCFRLRQDVLLCFTEPKSIAVTQ